MTVPVRHQLSQAPRFDRPRLRAVVTAAALLAACGSTGKKAAGTGGVGGHAGGTAGTSADKGGAAGLGGGGGTTANLGGGGMTANLGGGAAGATNLGGGGSGGDQPPADAAVDQASDQVNPACSAIARDAQRTVHLRITTDNECEVFVNGTSVGTTTNWSSPVTIDVSLFVHPGRENVVAVRGTNTSSQGGNDRGILGELDDLADGGTTPILVTDATWRVSKDIGTGTAWVDLGYDDSAWPFATAIAKNGDSPWGALLGNSTASWIWSGAVPASTAEKPNVETAYVRRRFFFGFDGSVTNQPGCP